MIAQTRSGTSAALAAVVALSLAGCGRDAASSRHPKAAGEFSTKASTDSTLESRRPTLRPVKLSTGGAAEDDRPGSLPTGEQRVESVMQALRPLQVLIGTWRGVTYKEIGGAKALEEPQWIWDVRSDREQPALVMTSITGPYLRSARLTYRLATQKYELRTTDREGTERVYQGTFTSPVDDVPGDDGSLQRGYELEFVQFEPVARRKMAKVVLHQQDNNRYLLEVFDERGDGLVKYDTVGNQRQGTSFAISEASYGEKTCIVSQGLGTMAVSHSGGTYYVCCTGCRAAFEEEPERWIAKLAERSKK